MMTARGISKMAKADTRVFLDLSSEEAKVLRRFLFDESWPEEELNGDVLNGIHEALAHTIDSFPEDVS